MSRRDRTTRRRVLASLGAGTGILLAGCNGFSDGGPNYQDGDIGNVSGDNRTAAEMATAQGLAEREASDAVTPLETLEIRDHAFVHEGGYLGSTVQGTVANTGGDRIEIVEVRVRVYDGDGNLLDRYLASTGDLEGDGTWAFQVIVLEAPDDVADYEIAVLGTPS